MLDKIKAVIDLEEVTISTNTTVYEDVKLLNADHNAICFLHGDKKVYIPTNSITSLTHEQSLKGHTDMTNLAEQIVGKELKNLGVLLEPEPVKVEVKQAPKVTTRKTEVYKPQPKQHDNRHKEFKTENSRHRMINKFTSDNPSWTKDWACEVGAKMRQDFWECENGSSDGVIQDKDLNEIIDLCHRDLGQLLDHLGIVFKPKGNDCFKEQLKSIIIGHSMFNNGSMNRNVKVVD